jgi:hypothetical protein
VAARHQPLELGRRALGDEVAAVEHSVDRIFTVVVLPDPFGPSSAYTVPVGTSRSIPSRTTWSP